MTIVCFSVPFSRVIAGLIDSATTEWPSENTTRTTKTGFYQQKKKNDKKDYALSFCKYLFDHWVFTLFTRYSQECGSDVTLMECRQSSSNRSNYCLSEKSANCGCFLFAFPQKYRQTNKKLLVVVPFSCLQQPLQSLLY